MRRTDLMDTSEKTHRAMVQLLRAKTPDWKVRQVFSLNAWTKKLRAATVPLRPKPKA